jgi:hypothetical protein
MMRSTLKLALFFGAAALLAGCGNNDGSSSQAGGGFNPQDMTGAWVPNTAGNEVYEFYSYATDAPYAANNAPVEKTGRVYKAGGLESFFTWSAQADGAIKLRLSSRTCIERPISTCPATGSATIAASGDAAQGASWSVSSDDNGDGVVDRKVSDVYKRQELDLSKLADGEFFLQRGELFDVSFSGNVSNKKLSIRLIDTATPVMATAELDPAKRRSLALSAGAPVAVWQSFTGADGAKVRLPVKMWYENIKLMAAANGGFILEYDFHRDVQPPAPVDATVQAAIAEFELVQKKSRSLALVDKFVRGPVIAPLDRFNTLLQLDFNINWVTGSAGNEVVFTSRTDGVVSHTDFNHGKYSESRAFKWVQKEDGSVVMTFTNGLAVTMRFIKPIAGGHRVLFTLPDALLGTRYTSHDFVKESAASAIAESELPGRWAFIKDDGVTINEVTLNRDKTTTGIIGGYWFLDTNGDVVSYECTDLQGRQISSYAECDATFNTDFSSVSFAHIRRLRFMHKDGNDYAVKYNGNVWGARYGVVDRDYFMIAWTYRFKRIGDL